MKSFEKILALHNIRPYLRESDWLDLKTKIGLDDIDLDRLRGKVLEDYFFLLVGSYELVESIVVFNEAFSKLSGTPSSDGLIVLKNGNKLWVDVKSSQEASKRITSKSRLDKQRNLAFQCGMVLYYAVHLKGHWGLFTADYVESKNYTIKYPNDLEQSIFDDIFNAFLIHIPEGLRVRKFYELERSEKTLLPIIHKGLGYLYRYEVSFNKVTVVIKGQKALMSLTAIENAFNSKYDKVDLADGTIALTHLCEETMFIYDYALPLAPIERTISGVTNTYLNSSSFISHVLDSMDKSGKLDLKHTKSEMIEFLLELRAKGIPFELVKRTAIEKLRYRID